MKPKVVHLVDELNPLGVMVALRSLCQSELHHEFDFDIRQVNFSRPFILNGKVDIICIHGAASWHKLSTLLWLRLRYPKTPIIFQEHYYSQGFVEHEIDSPQRFYTMLALTYKLMDKVVALSPSQKQWMLNNDLLYEEKVALLGQGRELKSLSPTAEFSVAKSDRSYPVFAAYGQFHRQKGFDILLEAMHLLPKGCCQLRLGGEGEDEPLLRAVSQGLNNVEWVGRIDDVSGFLANCDAVVIPSRWEPFGLMFDESLVMGKAVIPSLVDGLGDQCAAINESCDVWPIAELTPKGLAQVLYSFVEEWRLRQQGRHYVCVVDVTPEIEFQWHTVQMHWQDLLESQLPANF